MANKPLTRLQAKKLKDEKEMLEREHKQKLKEAAAEERLNCLRRVRELKMRKKGQQLTSRMEAAACRRKEIGKKATCVACLPFDKKQSCSLAIDKNQSRSQAFDKKKSYSLRPRPTTKQGSCQSSSSSAISQQNKQKLEGRAVSVAINSPSITCKVKGVRQDTEKEVQDGRPNLEQLEVKVDCLMKPLTCPVSLLPGTQLEIRNTIAQMQRNGASSSKKTTFDRDNVPLPGNQPKMMVQRKRNYSTVAGGSSDEPSTKRAKVDKRNLVGIDNMPANLDHRNLSHQRFTNAVKLSGIGKGVQYNMDGYQKSNYILLMFGKLEPPYLKCAKILKVKEEDGKKGYFVQPIGEPKMYSEWLDDDFHIVGKILNPAKVLAKGEKAMIPEITY